MARTVLSSREMDSCCLRWSEKCIRNSRNHRQRNPEKEGENPNEEGLCVQYMHMGTFDEEPRTVPLIHPVYLPGFMGTFDEEPRTVVLMGAYFEGNRPAGEDREIY